MPAGTFFPSSTKGIIAMPALVSVCCLAYNHEDYIARALESLVSQETDFPYEIIVHDDASTDRTAEILRDYEARYPGKIRGFYETENQFNNPEVNIIRDLLIPLSSGEYIAFCECDDAWTDPLKLKRQVGFLEAHPEYSMCVHAAFRHIVGTDEAEDEVYPQEPEDRDFSAEEIIRRGAGLFATNSFMVRKEAYMDPPDCFALPDVGDYPILMYAAFQGKIRFLKEPMSRHNEGVKDSWTVRIWKDPAKHVAHQKAMIAMLEKVDHHYDGRYHAAFADAEEERANDILETEYQIARKSGDRAALKQERFRKLIKRDRSIAFHKMLNEHFYGLVKLKHKIWRDRKE